MRKLIFVALAAMLYLLPQTAFAQTTSQPLLPQVQAEVQAQAKRVGDVFGLSANQVLAIGIGAVGGFAVAEALHVAAVLGVLAGGVIGNWWYEQNLAEGTAGVAK